MEALKDSEQLLPTQDFFADDVVLGVYVQTEDSWWAFAEVLRELSEVASQDLAESFDVVLGVFGEERGDSPLKAHAFGTLSMAFDEQTGDDLFAVQRAGQELCRITLFAGLVVVDE